MARSFHARLLPAPVGGGFAMDDWWVWCGSVARGDDGRYHMFASRWPRGLSFTPHWLTNSEVVRATSDTPGGPYHFEEIVLPARGASYWDGQMTHNPTIHRAGDTWLLFYTGTTYSFPRPEPGHGIDRDVAARQEARANQRIGLATAPSPEGPWARADEPLMPPIPDSWEQMMNTNPAPCVRPDGSVLLVYKAVANQQDLLRLGVAAAPHWDGPYERLRDEPILRFDATGDHVEDAYVWSTGDHYEMIFKDMRGGICGEAGGGVHATSADGVDWQVSSPALAYSRHVRWDDGTTTHQGHLERPQLLIEAGQPTWLFAATADGPGGFRHATRTWNLAIPLAP